MKNEIEEFVKVDLNINFDYSELTDKLKSTQDKYGENYIDKDDRVIYKIPKRWIMTNLIVYTTKKIIVGNRGGWDGDLHFTYDEFISFKLKQRKLFFRKLDLCVTPSYDEFAGGGSSPFYVNRNYADNYKALHHRILKIYYPNLF
jgi:hypothetical protein